MQNKLTKSLMAEVTQLPLPTNYMGGLEPDMITLPSSVLLFHRTSASYICGKSNSLSAGTAHHRYLLIFNLKTEGDVILDRVSFRLHQLQSILVFPFQFHHYANCESENISWLFSSFDLPNSDEHLNSLRNTPVELNETVTRYALEQCELFNSPDRDMPEVRNQIAVLTTAILNELLRIYRTSKEKNLPQDKDSGDLSKHTSHALFRKVGEYVRYNLDKPIQIIDIANGLAMSPSHLRNIFRDSFGISLGWYIRRQRVLRAACLLETTSLSITQIASQCGFTSIYSFSRTFKQEIGNTPGQYRSKSKK